MLPLAIAGFDAARRRGARAPRWTRWGCWRGKGDADHALGRRAAAAVHRARGREPPGGAARRRADRQPGRSVGRRDPGDVPRLQPGRRHRGDRHPRRALHRAIAARRAHHCGWRDSTEGPIAHEGLACTASRRRLRRHRRRRLATPLATLLNIAGDRRAL